MDFLKTSLFCSHVMLLLSIVNYSSSCAVETTRDLCTTTVRCYGRPTGANFQTCSDSPNVTFIITSSTQENLVPGYFSSTNFDGRVRYIIGVNNSWHTIESAAFRYYIRTKVVKLTENHIVNINNEAFAQLLHLTTLDLSHNHIEKLQPKSLNMARGNSLETVDLSNNKLLNLQNDVFASLSNLTLLNLKNNKLTSLSEDCFSNLKELKILHLENNELTSLNTALQPLKGLQLLDLSFNKIRSLSGYETNRLNGLTHLNVSYNELETVDANCFTNSLELQVLDLSHNNIHSPIEPIMFMNNNLLWYLSFFDNKITIVKDFSFSFNSNSIKFIYLDKNNLSMNITHDTLKGLSNISEFVITNQNITAIKEKAFVDMKHLQHLNLSRNAIKSIDNTSFEFVTENLLAVLDFSFNNISNLFFLQYFRSNMTEIYLNCNKISILLNGTFKNHNKLIKLDLSENKIVVIEQYSLPLHMLQYLNINDNKINGNITKDIFSPAPFIKQLDLCNFVFKRINENAFVDLPVLSKLNLSSNELEFIHSNNFMNMDEMLVLDVSNNKLFEFESIDVSRLINVAPNLVSLSIGGNPISCKEIVRAVQLKEFKKLEITSMHQILHDDNVHGIRCGNITSFNSTTEVSHNKIIDNSAKENKEDIGISSSSMILLTWCAVITTLAFPMDGIGRLGHDPPREPSANWWVLTTADAAGTNGLTCFPKHGRAGDSNFWSPIQVLSITQVVSASTT
ncbi:hypothetical protein evm_009103 [Chilo suppressalis]|nr:hypothetical protein evm_009103 [Chilo suppressalis]